ncbi:MAG TPA: bifunctional riboflavin kinase/FAD synthetase [Candidatus Acidoferrales bacterium]|nr:bifunctional riboflavin kinase/FAD synthetase [Candidatus Acidoferrales bacterium]
MKLIHSAKELGNGSRKVCLAIGVFDGVHLGHQQIIRQTVADAHQHAALPVVVTFDRHPNAVVAPDRVPLQIYSGSQKLRAIAALGVEALLEITFDQPFSEKAGDRFVRELAEGFGKIHSICVGADFVFGHRRTGNVALLEKLGGELHYQVHGLAAVALDGQTVSSTRIRDLIRTGNLDAASQMLGRPYSICGRVVAGDGIGRQLGFPTANLETGNLILPPNGVYSAAANLEGRFFRAALNIGVRPTISSSPPKLRVEAHLVDFTGNLYGEELELEIGAKLRDEIRFSSPSELRERIKQDVAAVRGME